jgi:hypothetical protein
MTLYLTGRSQGVWYVPSINDMKKASLILFTLSGAVQSERELSDQKENNCRIKRVFLPGRAFCTGVRFRFFVPIIPVATQDKALRKRNLSGVATCG